MTLHSWLMRSTYSDGSPMMTPQCVMPAASWHAHTDIQTVTTHTHSLSEDTTQAPHTHTQEKPPHLVKRTRARIHQQFVAVRVCADHTRNHITRHILQGTGAARHLLPVVHAVIPGVNFSNSGETVGDREGGRGADGHDGNGDARSGEARTHICTHAQNSSSHTDSYTDTHSQRSMKRALVI